MELKTVLRVRNFLYTSLWHRLVVLSLLREVLEQVSRNCPLSPRNNTTGYLFFPIVSVIIIGACN